MISLPIKASVINNVFGEYKRGGSVNDEGQTSKGEKQSSPGRHALTTDLCFTVLSLRPSHLTTQTGPSLAIRQNGWNMRSVLSTQEVNDCFKSSIFFSI